MHWPILPVQLGLKGEAFPLRQAILRADSRKPSYGQGECVCVNTVCSSVTQGQMEREGADSNWNRQSLYSVSAVNKAIHHNICQNNTIKENERPNRGLTVCETLTRHPGELMTVAPQRPSKTAALLFF